jgi:hypothetical protein
MKLPDRAPSGALRGLLSHGRTKRRAVPRLNARSQAPGPT